VRTRANRNASNRGTLPRLGAPRRGDSSGTSAARRCDCKRVRVLLVDASSEHIRSGAGHVNEPHGVFAAVQKRARP